MYVGKMCKYVTTSSYSWLSQGRYITSILRYSYHCSRFHSLRFPMYFFAHFSAALITVLYKGSFQLHLQLDEILHSESEAQVPVTVIVSFGLTVTDTFLKQNGNRIRSIISVTVTITIDFWKVAGMVSREYQQQPRVLGTLTLVWMKSVCRFPVIFRDHRFLPKSKP